MTTSSQIVGTTVTGIFNISALVIPANSIIYLYILRQTAFPDIIQNINSLSCSSNATILNCGLLSQDSSSYTIGITNMFPIDFSGGTLLFNLSNMNNPPYNNSFVFI